MSESNFNFDRVVTDDVGFKLLQGRSIIKSVKYLESKQVLKEIGSEHVFSKKRVKCGKARKYDMILQSVSTHMANTIKNYGDNVMLCRSLFSCISYIGISIENFKDFSVVKNHPYEFDYLRKIEKLSYDSVDWRKIINCDFLYNKLKPFAGIHDLPSLKEVQDLDCFNALVSRGRLLEKAIIFLQKVFSTFKTKNESFLKVEAELKLIVKLMDDCDSKSRLLRSTMQSLFVTGVDLRDVTNLRLELEKTQSLLKKSLEKIKSQDKEIRDMTIKTHSDVSELGDMLEKALEERKEFLDKCCVLNADNSNLEMEKIRMIEHIEQLEEDIENLDKINKELEERKVTGETFIELEDWNKLSDINRGLENELVETKTKLDRLREKMRFLDSAARCHNSVKSSQENETRLTIEYRGCVSKEFKLKSEGKYGDYVGDLLEGLVECDYEKEISRIMECDTKHSPYDYVNKNLKSHNGLYYREGTRKYIDDLGLNPYDMNEKIWKIAARVCNDVDLKLSLIGKRGIMFESNYDYETSSEVVVEGGVVIDRVETRIRKPISVKSEESRSYCMGLLGCNLSGTLLDKIYFANH